ncbi:ribosome biogenesis GTPase Der [Nakamurella flavida]|uniref:GTPase Der n=1 Tax=Nakamurella flavida TaxID=363630 RepID=A0A938YN01_9ACTN|nr:ribosome biogenesis GTPase Der [Nakamurella flavida]MBM9478254.1 ribosome biogenesis GTPase Der [Nakamurella flavida]
MGGVIDDSTPSSTGSTAGSAGELGDPSYFPDGDSAAIGTWSDESEFAAWEDGLDGDGAFEPTVPTPTLAVVGRPNVGKSSLVNRIIGRREAVVQDIPGVTRDRVSYEALWGGRKFTVVDTGGWEPDAKGLQGDVAAQAERAMLTTDAVMMVVDASVGATATDEAMAKVLRRSKRPVILAANKVDDERVVGDVASLWTLGLGEPHPVSALHGRGSGDLLDAMLAALPATPSEFSGGGNIGPRRVALLGKPNVGKSSLLNKLAGDSRSVVNAMAGTTIDPVDSLVEIDGEVWRFVDTAGLRRRVHQAKGMEFYASLRTQTALESAEVAIVLIDSSEPLTEQDQRVITMVIESGRALVIALNKADLVDAERREDSNRELERDLVRVQWAQRINISALTGRATHRLAPALRTALESWDRRIPTGRLNGWLAELIQGTPPPVRGGKQPRVLFATQAANRPPTFVLFTTGFLEAGYRRFIERRLREDFAFTGSPVRVNVRVREKRSGRK